MTLIDDCHCGNHQRTPQQHAHAELSVHESKRRFGDVEFNPATRLT